jgi:hypothetical protein
MDLLVAGSVFNAPGQYGWHPGEVELQRQMGWDAAVKDRSTFNEFVSIVSLLLSISILTSHVSVDIGFGSSTSSSTMSLRTCPSLPWIPMHVIQFLLTELHHI